jgi:hypothetical protein
MTQSAEQINVDMKTGIDCVKLSGKLDLSDMTSVKKTGLAVKPASMK